MTDYQDALVLENLDLVNWVIRTRISIPNRPLLTYDDFYAIGCEAICRAALKYQPDMGAFAPFACRYIYNAIVDHCRAMNYRLERNVEISEDENASLLDMLTCTSVDFDETVTDATAMSALAACKEKYNGVARKGVEAIELKLCSYACPGRGASGWYPCLLLHWCCAAGLLQRYWRQDRSCHSESLPWIFPLRSQQNAERSGSLRLHGG